MVICKYFLSNNCRFGSKCINEHLDIKQILKSEIESAITGSQWPLSCFGPFKEKICLPNFIEDKSFEEIRYLCYEAKKQNCFPQFQQQFNQQILEAQNIMKQILSMSPEVVNIVTQIYESGEGMNKSITSNTNNPFSSVADRATNSTNLFGNNQVQSNPFIKSTTNSFGNTTSANNVFNSNNPNTGLSNLSSNNVFGNSSQSSVFTGSVQQQNPQSQNSVFGGGFTTPQTKSIFGGQTQPTNSVFAGSNSQVNMQQNQTFNNVFGSNNTSNSSGIFGPNQPPSKSLFQSNTGNLFNQAESTNPTYNEQNQSQNVTQSSFNQQNQTQNTAFVNQPTQNNSFAFSSFLQNGNNLQSQTQPQNFGQQPIGSGVFSNNPQNQNIFTQQVQHQQQPPPQSEEQHQQPNSQQNLFNQTSKNQIQSQLFLHQPQQANNLSNESQNSILQAMPLNSNEGMSQNIFNQSASSNLQFNNQTLQRSEAEMSNLKIYSKLDSLTNEVLEAFQADHFVIGKIPTIPPPKELCH